MDGIYWHVFDLSNPGAHFEVDLMDRKAEVKCIIEDVINNMSDDDGGEEESDGEAEANGKEEKAKGDPDRGEEKWCHGLDLHAWLGLYYASGLDWSWEDYSVGSVQLGHRHNKLVTWVVQDC